MKKLTFEDFQDLSAYTMEALYHIGIAWRICAYAENGKNFETVIVNPHFNSHTDTPFAVIKGSPTGFTVELRGAPEVQDYEKIQRVLDTVLGTYAA